MKKVVSLLLCVMLILMVSACGETEKPSAPTAHEKTIDYTPYNAKIEEYATALQMDEDAFFQTYGEPDCSSINGNTLSIVYGGGNTISHVRYDIDGNGVEELLFSDSLSVIDAYTLKDGNVIKLYEDCDFGYRTLLHITPKGEMVIQWGNALEGNLEVGKLNTDGTVVEKVAAYYVVDITGATPDREDAQLVSEEEFLALVEQYGESIFDTLAWTKIERK